VSPHPAGFSVDACALSGTTNICAGKAARNDINTASPWLAVKGLHIIPDGKRFQASVVLSRHKNACGIGVPFDGANGSPSEEFASEYSSTSTCEKSQLIQFLLLSRCRLKLSSASDSTNRVACVTISSQRPSI
jgi:hypothetical protein